MTQIGSILLLAASLTFVITCSLATVSALARGKLKNEPSQPWVKWSEHPIRFAVTVAFNALLAQLFFYGVLVCTNDLLR
jgi:hypothetical protein